MRPRTAYPSTYFINDTEKTLVPGPGTYPDTLCMNSKGYMSSRVRNANRTTLSFNEKRFKSSGTGLIYCREFNTWASSIQ